MKKVTGEEIYRNEVTNANKAYFANAPIPNYEFLNIKSYQLGLVNNREYTFLMEGTLDYGEGGKTCHRRSVCSTHRQKPVHFLGKCRKKTFLPVIILQPQKPGLIQERKGGKEQDQTPTGGYDLFVALCCAYHKRHLFFHENQSIRTTAQNPLWGFY